MIEAEVKFSAEGKTQTANQEDNFKYLEQLITKSRGC